jgi:hypothetical protein
LDAADPAMKRRHPVLIALAVFLLFGAWPLAAHVGSPDVFYEGAAGPYHLFVTVRVPQVIPGIAEIEIRSESKDVREIQIMPLRLAGLGSSMAPTPDTAQQSKDDPQFFTGSLWLMESGALQVRVMVDGGQGKGEMSVPVPSFAQTVLPMQGPLKAVLAVLLVILAVGIVSIVGAGSREGKLEPGETPAATNKRRSRITMAVTAVVVLAILFLGNAWWGANAADYRQNVSHYKPPVAITSLENGNRLVIRAGGEDENWTNRLDLATVIPDHGHLMHLFIISDPGMEHMWHLHPERIAPDAFEVDLPTMPEVGDHQVSYQVFADVVDRRGFPWTMVGGWSVLNVGTRPSTSYKPVGNESPLSGDDSCWSGPTLVEGADTSTAQLADGGSMTWQRPPGPLKAGVPMNFTFTVLDKNGKPAQDVVPYMGMAGHAEFVRSDFSVFAHVHPAGSVSMAALELAQAGLNGNLIMPAQGGMQAQNSQAMLGMSMPMATTQTISPEVSFPYGFPQPGEYRIFVQVRRADGVQTAVFDARVE